MQIVLTQSQKQILSQQAKEQSPNEACALLFGKINDDKGIVEELYLSDNIEESPINFTISNEQLIKGYQIAEEKKLEVIGIFHSHPNSEPYPSSTDKKFMQTNPVVWIIYSGITMDFKAFILDSEVLEVPILTTNQ